MFISEGGDRSGYVDKSWVWTIRRGGEVEEKTIGVRAR